MVGLRLWSSMCYIFASAYEFYNWSCRAVGAAWTLIPKALQHAELSSEPVWDSLRKGGDVRHTWIHERSLQETQCPMKAPHKRQIILKNNQKEILKNESMHACYLKL